MVAKLATLYVLWGPAMLAESEPGGMMLERLSPLNQLRVIMGLFVVVILGIFLFIVVKAGSHMVKGMSAPANRLRSESPLAEDDWAKKPLNVANLPDENSDSETASTDDGDGE